MQGSSLWGLDHTGHVRQRPGAGDHVISHEPRGGGGEH